MIKKFDFGKAAVFIDAANILYSQKTLNWKIDFQKLKDFFNKNGKIISFNYYTGIIKTNKKQNQFLKKLQSYGYNVFTKEVKFIKLQNNRYLSKGNLDVELALDAYRLKKDYKSLILFSGDSDFSYLIDLLKKDAKRIFVFSTRGHISKELLIRAKYIDIRKLKEEIIFNT